MMELMSMVALEVGAERRREVAIASMRAARGGERRVRQAIGTALVAVGQRIAADRPQASPRMQPSGDCL